MCDLKATAQQQATWQAVRYLTAWGVWSEGEWTTPGCPLPSLASRLGNWAVNTLSMTLPGDDTTPWAVRHHLLALEIIR